MTNPFATEMDALAHEAFLDAGIADAAAFTPRNGAVVPCTVTVDRDMVTAARAGIDLLKDQAVVRVLKSEVASAPRQGDTVTITASGEVLTVARRDRADDGSWVLICQA